MSDELIYSNIDEIIFSTFLLSFTIWRVNKSSKVQLLKAFTGNLRSVSVLCFLSSIICLLAYNLLILFLSTYADIDRRQSEDLGTYFGKYVVTVYQREINLVQVLNVCLYLSKSLTTTTLFLMIGLWVPCAYNFAMGKRLDVNRNDLNYLFFDDKGLRHTPNIESKLSNVSVSTFAVLYSFFRIPLTIFIDFYHFYNEKTTIFYRNFFYSTEIYVVVLLMFVLEIKFYESVKYNDYSFDTPNLLLFLLVLDSSLRYTINILAINITNPFIDYLIEKMLFFTFLSIRILIISMLCPLKSQLFDDDLIKKKEKCNREEYITDIPSPRLETQATIVEFPDTRKDLRIEK
ncbi:hypothetical protein SLOPH_1795 [Spraguea lophii 42_110]|uniref:Uncharacterized protein n=1 Tax=Spraguea lophii (strain 42_110) TaxID=1358809 RepID=S7WAL1_SPRLO|nr:hypothetical protein SLOPH_1795 [Spraguea lophii 42_110]